MINKEDKADVARHMGKALAKKVALATKDGKGGWSKNSKQGRETYRKVRRATGDFASDNYVKLRPTAEARSGRLGGEIVTAFSPYRPDTKHDRFKIEGHKGLSTTPTKFTDVKKFLGKNSRIINSY